MHLGGLTTPTRRIDKGTLAQVAWLSLVRRTFRHLHEAEESIKEIERVLEKMDRRKFPVPMAGPAGSVAPTTPAPRRLARQVYVPCVARPRPSRSVRNAVVCATMPCNRTCPSSATLCHETPSITTTLLLVTFTASPCSAGGPLLSAADLQLG